ncbi:MAG: hypothetical protein NVS3B20_27040 [Polyangiales bacterium]
MPIDQLPDVSAFLISGPLDVASISDPAVIPKRQSDPQTLFPAMLVTIPRARMPRTTSAPSLVAPGALIASVNDSVVTLRHSSTPAP